MIGNVLKPVLGGPPYLQVFADNKFVADVKIGKKLTKVHFEASGLTNVKIIRKIDAGLDGPGSIKPLYDKNIDFELSKSREIELGDVPNL